MSTNSKQPLVGILMGSKSDWETMQAAAKILDEFGVPLIELDVQFSCE
jgi:5-(carboxyamino)imidazole ribonucleotide mutase